MNIEEYLNKAVDPAAIVSDLIEEVCREYEENPLTTAYENNMKKFEELQYLEPDDLLTDMFYSANQYIFSSYRRKIKLMSGREPYNQEEITDADS